MGGTPALSVTGGVVFCELSWAADTVTIEDGSFLELGPPVKMKVSERL